MAEDDLLTHAYLSSRVRKAMACEQEGFIGLSHILAVECLQPNTLAFSKIPLYFAFWYRIMLA